MLGFDKWFPVQAEPGNPRFLDAPQVILLCYAPGLQRCLGAVPLKAPPAGPQSGFSACAP